MADITIGYGVSAESQAGVNLNARLSITFPGGSNNTPELNVTFGAKTKIGGQQIGTIIQGDQEFTFDGQSVNVCLTCLTSAPMGQFRSI